MQLGDRRQASSRENLPQLLCGRRRSLLSRDSSRPQAAAIPRKGEHRPLRNHIGLLVPRFSRCLSPCFPLPRPDRRSLAPVVRAEKEHRTWWIGARGCHVGRQRAASARRVAATHRPRQVSDEQPPDAGAQREWFCTAPCPGTVHALPYADGPRAERAVQMAQPHGPLARSGNVPSSAAPSRAPVQGSASRARARALARRVGARGQPTPRLR
mmetsp:Transcript_26992/g.63687  ORF Transcript_26992/g.63687 Transcript_26992/m.63687 type:complete len:212 (+) Transcript_26992:638-1273(+)